MTRMSAGRYARAIERLWSGLQERAVVLSPRDWSLVSDWYARGIPLEIVEQAVQRAAERESRRRAPGGRPRGLAYLAPAVEEAWDVVRRGHSVAPASPSGGPVERDRAEAWRRRRDAEPAASPLRALLSELLRRIDAGGTPAAQDAALDAALPDSAPSGLVRAVEQEVEREFLPFRGRMAPATLRATCRRAVVERLRGRLGLPRLAG